MIVRKYINIEELSDKVREIGIGRTAKLLNMDKGNLSKAVNNQLAVSEDLALKIANLNVEYTE